MLDKVQFMLHIVQNMLDNDIVQFILDIDQFMLEQSSFIVGIVQFYCRHSPVLLSV